MNLNYDLLDLKITTWFAFKRVARTAVKVIGGSGIYLRPSRSFRASKFALIFYNKIYLNVISYM